MKPYDPVLDLRDYKYPTIDLLENHGSEKIVQDATACVHGTDPADRIKTL